MPARHGQRLSLTGEASLRAHSAATALWARGGAVRLTGARGALSVALSKLWQAEAMRQSKAKLAVLTLVLACSGAVPAHADPTKYPPPNTNCRNTGSFESWLAGFRKAAAAGGISRATISAALDGMTLDPGVIARDRRQSFFAQSFTAFAGKLISQNRTAERRGAAQAASRAAGQGRAAVRRAGARDRRLLGAGERFRRRHGQPARAALARHAGLRLPPARDVPRRADRCAPHHRPRAT